MNESQSDIARIRAAIDELDAELISLLSARAELVLQMRRAKDEAGLDQFDPEREAEIQERLASLNRGPLSDADLQRIYEILLDVMKSFG